MKHPPKSAKAILSRRRGKREAAGAAKARDLALAAERESRAAERARAKLEATQVPVNPANLARNPSYGQPEFVSRGYYLDKPFVCKSCGIDQTWTATQQKWWYEVAKGDVWTTAVLCKPCRRNEQARRLKARTTHLEGLQRKARSAP